MFYTMTTSSDVNYFLLPTTMFQVKLLVILTIGIRYLHTKPITKKHGVHGHSGFGKLRWIRFERKEDL